MLMGWDLAGLTIGQRGELTTAFEFEITFGGEGGNGGTFRGDGILLCSGRVRFNREDELVRLARGMGLNPQNFLDYLSDCIITQAADPAAQGGIYRA